MGREAQEGSGTSVGFCLLAEIYFESVSGEINFAFHHGDENERDFPMVAGRDNCITRRKIMELRCAVASRPFIPAAVVRAF